MIRRISEAWAYWVDLRNDLLEMYGRWKRGQSELNRELRGIWHDLYDR